MAHTINKDNKTCIIIDADVLMNFHYVDGMKVLLNALPGCELAMLDVVYDAVAQLPAMKKTMNRECIRENEFVEKVRRVRFSPKSDSMKEYFNLQERLGEGESANFVYCKDSKDKVFFACNDNQDTIKYCRDNGIRRVSFNDIMFYGIKNRVIPPTFNWDLIFPAM